MVRIGIDFGGTKIEAAACRKDGQLLATLRAADARDL
jgi:predicted NBD/HSP70 family sugar kinase